MTPDPTDTPAPTGDAAGPVLFADLALPEALLSALTEDGYAEPSPIQASIIPHLLEGRDVIGQAQTGTGKTAAFALPILAQLAARREEEADKKAKGPAALILAPTRELAIQVADAFGKYGRKLKKARVLAVYGGADFRGQAVPLRGGVDVVVGTPGRVMDHMRRGTLDVSHVRTLVLDEADEMLRMGFVEDVEWVLSETPAGRQVALFSATMPHAIKQIAEKQLNDPARVSIAGGSKTADTVRQRYWRVEGVGKVEALSRLLAVEPVDAALVFVRTRAATAELARALEDAGFPAAPLSGDVPQAQRERTIEALRRGRLKLVVATDVAARGIDVQSITHVFNFDVPEDAEAYIHRIGRTGRAGRTGETVLFVENRQRRLLQNIERATGQPIEKMALPTSQEVHAFQLQRFGEQLKERLVRKGEAGKPAALRGFIEAICEETGRDPLDVAAFLVGPAMNATVGGGAGSGGGAKPAPDAARFARPARPERPGRPGHSDRPTPRGPVGGAAQVYRVAVGRAHGLRAGHLVGAIANETGLDGRDIGGIRIFDSYSTVELPADMPSNVFELLQRTTVLGNPLRIRPDEARRDDHTPAMRHTTHRSRMPIKHPPRKEAADQAKENFPPKAKTQTKPHPTPGAKPKAKTPTKFKPKGQAHPAAGGKPFKKFKPGKPSGGGAGKPKSAAGGKAQGDAAGKPGAGVKPRPAGKAKSGGGHSLVPAAFAGGKKPKRYNKRVRPK